MLRLLLQRTLGVLQRSATVAATGHARAQVDVSTDAGVHTLSSVRYCSVLNVIVNSSLRMKSEVWKPRPGFSWPCSAYLSRSTYGAPWRHGQRRVPARQHAAPPQPGPPAHMVVAVRWMPRGRQGVRPTRLPSLLTAHAPAGSQALNVLVCAQTAPVTQTLIPHVSCMPATHTSTAAGEASSLHTPSDILTQCCTHSTCTAHVCMPGPALPGSLKAIVATHQTHTIGTSLPLASCCVTATRGAFNRQRPHRHGPARLADVQVLLLKERGRRAPQQRRPRLHLLPLESGALHRVLHVWQRLPAAARVWAWYLCGLLLSLERSGRWAVALSRWAHICLCLAGRGLWGLKAGSLRAAGTSSLRSPRDVFEVSDQECDPVRWSSESTQA